jgi:hypothetical protein
MPRTREEILDEIATYIKKNGDIMSVTFIKEEIGDALDEYAKLYAKEMFEKAIPMERFKIIENELLESHVDGYSTARSEIITRFNELIQGKE